MANLIATIDTDRGKCRTHPVAPSRKTTARSRWGQVHRLGDNRVTAGVADWDHEVVVMEWQDQSVYIEVRDAKTRDSIAGAAFTDAAVLAEWLATVPMGMRPVAVPAPKKTRRGKRHRNRLHSSPQFQTTGDIEGSEGRSA